MFFSVVFFTYLCRGICDVPDSDQRHRSAAMRVQRNRDPSGEKRKITAVHRKRTLSPAIDKRLGRA